jgi:hypothetical protein
VACPRPENNITAVSARSGDGSIRLRMSSLYSIVMRARESTPYRLTTLTHPGSTASEMTSGNLRFPARARATSHAQLSAHARRGSASGQGPRAAGVGPREARAQPEQPSLQLGGQEVGR